MEGKRTITTEPNSRGEACGDAQRGVCYYELPPNVLKTTRKVRQLSVGKLLAQVITCIHTGDSVHNLFDVSKGGNLLA